MNAERPVRLAVVGHTNVGKTSLVRTLMRDSEFGEVAPTASTTRQVQAARLLTRGQVCVELYDTPGLEDAGALIEQLDAGIDHRHAGLERIRDFLGQAEARGRFEQEARVLARLLECDAALYVIDAREPVLGKYRDELSILALCARPVLPVLNFIARPGHRADAWRDLLARIGLHAQVEFDSVVFALEAECRLWQRLAALLDRRHDAFEALIEDRRQRGRQIRRAARRRIAEYLVDCSAACRFAPLRDDAARQQVGGALAQAVEHHESSLVRSLLELTGFRSEWHEGLQLPIDGAAWQAGAFHPGTLEQFGRLAGGGAAAGAATGAAVDLALGGLSLGTATLIGALAGGGAGSAWPLRHALLDRVQRRTRISLDPQVLMVLAARAFALLDALEQRGHAAQTPIELVEHLPDPWQKGGLPRPLQRARRHPEVSMLNDGEGRGAALREQLTEVLIETLFGADPA